MRDAIDLGLKPTSHADFNVVPIDQMFVLWSAVNRVDRDGDVIGGEDPRITPQEALEEDSNGTNPTERRGCCGDRHFAGKTLNAPGTRRMTKKTGPRTGPVL